ncbi:minor tail protein [Arthrobacter phage TaylorSipht]|nr:minor tail protein [Arthrobacter phage TaylorSipht]
MLPIEATTLEALNGSRTGDRLEVFAWYDGELLQQESLPVTDWGLEFDGSPSKQVQGVLELTVADPSGELSPWLWDDPLGVGGAVLQCRYVVGGAGTINRGWFRITANAPKESWYSRVIREDGFKQPGSSVPQGHRLVMVSGGAAVPLTAEDLTVRLALDEFLAPEQPVGSAPTAIGEIVRIVGESVPLDVADDVVDVGVPVDLTYEGPKIDAVMDLAGRAGASVRMGGDGELQVYVKSKTPVWEVAGGDDGALINIDREQKVDVLANVGIVRGERKDKDETGKEITVPLLGVAQVLDGPLRVGGPHGRIPRRLESSLLNTQAQVDEAARSLITNYLDSFTVDLEVTCLPNPALQVGDWVVVTQPVIGGQLLPVDGEVVSLSLRGTGGAVGNMTMKVRVAASKLQDLRRALKTSRGG